MTELKFEDMTAAASGDRQNMLGKLLYFSLPSVLVDKDDLRQLCVDMNIPYAGGNRLSVSDAFRSATGDVRDRIISEEYGERRIYQIYCRDNRRISDSVISRELVKETMHQETNQYEKLANISYDKDSQIFSYDNLAYDSQIDAMAYCRRAEELFELYQRCANRRQVETICVNFLRMLESTKLSVNGHLYFVPRHNMEKVDIFEDFVAELIIDEYAAMVVRTIFQLKMEGYSQQAIANYLSSEGVLPPAAYKQQQGLKYQSGFQAVGDNNAWSPVAVRAILENPIYIGTLVQGKRGTPNYKIKQMKLRSKEDWCIVEKNHAPIISEELFTSVQHLLSLDTRTSPSKKVVQPLAGMLYCADCGRAMCRRSVKRGNRTFYYYVCSTHKRSKLCSSHSISQTVLENVVLRAIQKQIEMVVDIDQLIHEIGQKSVQAAKHRQLDMTIEEKEKQITEQKEYRMRLLEAFHDDLISRTEYDMMRQRYTQRIDALQAVLASLHERRQALEEGAADTRNWVAEYTKFRKIDRLTREMVAGLIRRITVSEGKQVTIQFNYADELASYQQMIAAAAKEVG